MEQRHVGRWWLPDEPTHLVAGELEFGDDRPARLELQEPLTDGLRTSVLDVVLGTTVKGEPLTLSQVGSLGISTTTSRKLDEVIRRETLAPRIVFVGAHLPGEVDRRFTRAVFDFTDLMGWAGDSGLKQSFGVTGADLAVSLVVPTAREALLPKGRLKLRHGWGTAGDGVQSMGIEKSVGFVIDVDQPLSIDEWLREFGNPLRHLLTFSADQANEVSALEFTTYRYDETNGTQVSAWYSQFRVTPEPERRGFDFLFDAWALGDDFAPRLVRWFELYEQLGTVLDVYLGPRYRPDTFMDNHFLNTVSAAEGYHRTMYRNELLPRAAHKARVKAVVDASPREHRTWLKERLAFSNEPTLADRLRELHARAFNVVGGVVGTADEFSKPVVKMRNGSTHRGKGTPKAIPSGIEMFYLTQSASLVLMSCLLLDLGFDEDFVVSATRRSRAFRWLQHRG